MKKVMVASIVLILLLLSQAATTTAQTLPSQPTKEEEEKARQELERKVLLLLEEVVSDSQMLKLPENRAIVQASAADLLWARDEKRARGYFRDALTSIGEALAGTDRKDSSKLYAYWMLAQLRQQLLLLVARRDPQLALDLLAATRPPAVVDASQNFGMPDQELALEQSLATEAAANDPKRAFQMAEDSLSKGVSFSLLGVLRRLQQKDSELAQRLLADIIKKLQSDNPSRDPMILYVAQELLRSALRPQEASATGKGQGSAPTFKPLNFDEQAKRDLADVVTRAAVNTSTDYPGAISLQALLPDLEKLVPERAEQLRKRVADARKALDPEARKWMELEPLMRDGTADAMLEAAAKAPAGMRSALYSSAAWKLVQAGEAERARQIVSDNLGGQERDQALAQIDRRLVMRALEQGKLDEAKKLIARIQSKQGRATQIALLAAALMKKGERKMALELMDEARKLVNPQPDNQEEINTLLIVARAYAVVEPARAFELLDPLIDEANDVISAAALLDKFGSSQTPIFRKGEMILHPGFMTASSMFNQYGRQLGALARADFTRTKALADRLQRNEVRLMARLLIAQSVLSDRLSTTDEDETGLGLNISFSAGTMNTFEY